MFWTQTGGQEMRAAQVRAGLVCQRRLVIDSVQPAERRRAKADDGGDQESPGLTPERTGRDPAVGRGSNKN